MSPRFLAGLLLLLVTVSSISQADIDREIRNAQKLLSKGEYGRAFDEYQRIVKEKNNPLAKLTIAMFYDHGWGRGVDTIKACQWYEEAAQDELPLAADKFAHCLAEGIHREADLTQAASWYQKAADLGHHYSLCHLGELYIAGLGAEKDPVKGLALCRKSAEQGSVPAMLWLGRFYLGKNEVRDHEIALHWFSEAASYQSVEAQYQLGVMLRDGLGIDKDLLVARSWFEESASKGYVPAYFETARLYFNAPANPETGLWFENDLAKAYLWLSATHQRSGIDKERSQTELMLDKVREVMPETWIAGLDAKVDAHLKEYANDIDKK